MASGPRFVLVVCLVCVCALVGSARLDAQGGSTKTALTGTVVDAGGGIIPGATVVVTNNDTVCRSTRSRTPMVRSPCPRSIPASTP